MTTSSKKVLIIKSSPGAEYSVSNDMANYFMDQFANKDEQYEFVVRDLAQTPAPIYDTEIFNAFYTPTDQLTDEQVAVVSPSLQYIEELQSADIIVVASPMHNFGVTTLLKSYLDQICRIGLTFKYHETGPEGLLKGKQALIIATAGGDFTQEPAKQMDFQVPYLTHVLNFIGIEDVSVVTVHGMGLGDEYASQSKLQAQIALSQLALEKF